MSEEIFGIKLNSSVVEVFDFFFFIFYFQDTRNNMIENIGHSYM